MRCENHKIKIEKQRDTNLLQLECGSHKEKTMEAETRGGGRLA